MAVLTPTQEEQERKTILNAYKRLVKAAMPFTTKEERKEVRKAFEFSMELHKNVRRRSGEPYILHPLEVARIAVAEVGLLDKTSMICALLHDVVEDTDVEVKQIRREFGPQVAKIVDGLTKISQVFDPSTTQQVESYKKMLLTMSDDIRVALIKLADRLHNMRTLRHMKREKQLKIASETTYLYAPLAHRLGLYNIKQELEDLALKYTEPEIYQQIENHLQDSKRQRNRYIQNFIKPIQLRMKALDIPCDIKGRVKSITSIYNKMKAQQVGIEEVYDIFAIRIVVQKEFESGEAEKADCWRVYSAVTSMYRGHPDRLRDWISTPKTNGYESLHTTVLGPGGRWIEVQIRSQRMDYAAEKGLASHWKYKEKDHGQDELMEQWLARVREFLEARQTSAFDFVSDLKANVVAEQIYVFTPKGDLKILPVGSTALDMAYEIHTKIGHHCIGAKVNQRVVPLSHVLQNGDHVEVITSAKQTPKEEWLEYVKTSKARHKIKDTLKEARREIVERGKRIFDWKVNQLGITEEHNIIKVLLAEFRIAHIYDFYYRLGSHKIDTQRLLDFIQQYKYKLDEAVAPGDSPQKPQDFEQYLSASGEKVTLQNIVEVDSSDYTAIQLASCCKPLPGDEITAFDDPFLKASVVHRVSCEEAIKLMTSNQGYQHTARWQEPGSGRMQFLAGWKIVGQDRMGMLNDIVRAITLRLRFNIRSFTISSEDGMFEGMVMLYVHNLEELNRGSAELKKVAGIFSVQRIT
ncbi:MAG: bifunctional (p)ppGpp synthetase/guanosine-3',5'-bis(diphosphate) 3'-pyrophosphohydrolase [Bacteroidetes bacterium]|nr:bifunctional (p)ppGpp synthetase/guanosine-3',5'-bis(diphosphate) 3'-pyrophosphohydrolase [Bacteroidota bacterium]